jgi:hypothetical protein
MHCSLPRRRRTTTTKAIDRVFQFLRERERERERERVCKKDSIFVIVFCWAQIGFNFLLHEMSYGVCSW